jgi:hypothetical protein
MQIENKSVGHPLTKFQTGPRSAWEISIFRLKPTFFALIGHRDARFGDFLLHINEPNKVDPERTKKYEEVGPIPSLLAQFV